MSAEAVLSFWFAPDAQGSISARREWFRKDDAFDATIRERFGAVVAAALAGTLDDWTLTRRGALALVVVLDQFTRNIFRGTARAFAGDARALAIARGVVARGEDGALAPYERWFLYMPFQHAEDAASQERSIELFAQLSADLGSREPLDWAEKHALVIRRFGRYPQRNAPLGRTSTPAETDWLRIPGNRF